MWLPTSEAEIVERIAQGDLEETATLEFKGEVARNPKEVAKDICAMTVDGGVIIYGIGEDSDGKPISSPVPLKGTRERIDQIAQSGIHEPPEIVIKPIETAADPNIGFIVVHVPPSPRAPHMVQARNENRYYGRGATGNRRLGQGEVERLYHQRRKWERSREDLLDDLIANAPIQPDPDFGHLHLIAKPVTARETFLFDTISAEGVASTINEMAGRVRGSIGQWGAGSSRFGPGSCRLTPEGMVLYMLSTPAQGNRKSNDILDLNIHTDGTLTLFSGEIAQRRQMRPDAAPILIISETSISDLVVRFLSFSGEIYRHVGFYGAVDLGLALTGIEDSIPASFLDAYHLRGSFDEPEYRSTTRQLALSLQNSVFPAADRLLRQFFLAATQGHYQPFKQLQGS